MFRANTSKTRVASRKRLDSTVCLFAFENCMMLKAAKCVQCRLLIKKYISHRQVCVFSSTIEMLKYTAQRPTSHTYHCRCYIYVSSKILMLYFKVILNCLFQNCSMYFIEYIQYFGSVNAYAIVQAFGTHYKILVFCVI